MRAFVDSLLHTGAAPVVTVTAALDRTRAGAGEDRIRVRNLLADAPAQIDALADRAVAQRLADRLDDAMASVDLRGGAQGVVVVVTPESTEVRALPFPVRDGVSVGPTPATRFLVQGLRRSPRYRVLVVSDRATRLFEAVRDELVEVLDHGFPMTARIVPRDRRAVAGRFALPPGRDDKEQRRRFYREVDQALTAAEDVRDVILTSMLKRVDVGVYSFIKSVHDGTFKAGNTVFDLKADGVGYSTTGGHIDDITSKLDEYKQQIIDGTITVPTAP